MPKITQEDSKIPDLTPALGVWAKRHAIAPIQFSKAMDWSYPYAWRVLRGVDKFVPAAYGPFLLVYGLEALIDLFNIAGFEPKGEK